MEWNSEEGRVALRKAFPDGYLATRGVLTVGGWEAVGDGRGGVNWQYGMGVEGPVVMEVGRIDDTVKAALLAGDLLPLPDPSDRANWALLVTDLAESLGYPPEDHEALALVSVPHPEGKLWKLLRLGTYEHGGPEFACLGLWGPFGEDKDAAWVLVAAKVTLGR